MSISWSVFRDRWHEYGVGMWDHNDGCIMRLVLLPVRIAYTITGWEWLP